MRFEEWRAGWTDWLRGAPGRRHANGLAAADGAAACAAWMAEVAGNRRAPLYLVVRLWLIEPGVPERVLRAWFASLHRCAAAHRCLCIEVTRAAVPAVWHAAATRLAPQEGFVPDGRGWRAGRALPDS